MIVVRRYEVSGVYEAGPGEDPVYVLESLPGFGPELCSLRRWVAECVAEDGARFCAGVRCVSAPAHQTPDEADQYERRTMEACLALKPSKYTEDRAQFIRSIFRINQTESTDQVFCSELAAIILQARGALSATVGQNNIVPGDFLSRKGFCVDDFLRPGWQLGPLLRLQDSAAVARNAAEAAEAEASGPEDDDETEEAEDKVRRKTVDRSPSPNPSPRYGKNSTEDPTGRVGRRVVGRGLALSGWRTIVESVSMLHAAAAGYLHQG